MCGGNPQGYWRDVGRRGLSPRVRGKRWGVMSTPVMSGSIPACAGETMPTVERNRVVEVYPRVCGGNRLAHLGNGDSNGLSPRVRGKQRPAPAHPDSQGSIPACAGETPRTRSRPQGPRVYPRVCGGNVLDTRPAIFLSGLSPRVRGKPGGGASGLRYRRSIPACAGETAQPAKATAASRVYPRVCGGNGIELTVSPDSEGLSPRVRGKRPAQNRRRTYGRSIPACAGETLIIGVVLVVIKVYPRVCGGNRRGWAVHGHRTGLSPRVRGKRGVCVAEARWTGSIPACAGETGGLRRIRGRWWVYPRVCGGNVISCQQAGYARGLSPRVRGKLPMREGKTPCPRSIPACAGETPTAPAIAGHAGVYPRVCGGNYSAGCVQSGQHGLSPRVRGKRFNISATGNLVGSIPACAGETGRCARAGPPEWVYPRVCGGNSAAISGRDGA